MSEQKKNGQVPAMNETEAEKVLAEYNNQVEADDVHFYHVDGYYGDHSDSGCCC